MTSGLDISSILCYVRTLDTFSINYRICHYHNLRSKVAHDNVAKIATCHVLIWDLISMYRTLSGSPVTQSLSSGCQHTVERQDLASAP